MKGTLPFDPTDENSRQPIAERASQFRAALVDESRSATLVRLFDYLLERSGEPRAPKEIEVAMAVFGKSSEFDTSRDSTVRVHVHRLRQRLESFNTGKNGALLQIPKGEYRLLLADEPESPNEDAPLRNESEKGSVRKRLWVTGAVCFATTAALWAIVILATGRGSPANPSLAQTSLWKPFATHERMPLIVAGDLYMALGSGPEGKMDHLSALPGIRSGRDLDNYLKAHPDQFGKLRDRDIHRIPAGIATGAAALLPLISSIRRDAGMAEIVPASRISQEIIGSGNIIYVDYFSEPGMLRSAVIGQSLFATISAADEVKDLPSGRIFRMRPPLEGPFPNGASPQDPYGYDYGYIASYPGSAGNRILIISGVDDAALTQMVKLVSDKRQLDMLSRRIGGATAFEALYQVRIAGGLIVDTSLIIARSLKSGSRASPAPSQRTGQAPGPESVQ